MRMQLTLDGVPYDCRVEYSPYEAPSYEHGPGSPAQCYVYAATLAGHPVLDHLSEATVQQLEDAALAVALHCYGPPDDEDDDDEFDRDPTYP